MSQVFEFDEHFQQCYLAFLLRDSEFSSKVYRDLRPELFTSTPAQFVARVALSWISDNGTAPGSLIYQEIRNILKNSNVTYLSTADIAKYLDDLFVVPLQNKSFILQEHAKFFKHQQLLKSFPDFKNFVQAGKFDDALVLLKEIVTYRPDRNMAPGVRLSSDPEERVRRRLDQSHEWFAFLIPEIDERVKGVRRGSLNVFQSQRSSSGKTTALIHLIKSYVLQGKKVLVFSTEDGEEAYQDKLDMSIAGLFMEQLTDGDTIRRALKHWYGFGGDVYIKGVDCMSSTVDDLRDFATFLRNTENFTPDVVIIDYADELITEPPSESTFETYRVIFGLLRKWAQQEDIVVWTAMQSNRSGEEGDYADMGSAGLSLAKTWIPDFIATINRSPAQEEENQTEVFVAKNRHGKARFSVIIDSDFDRSQFYTRPK